jgi:Protein of unknown function (DUF4058)
MPSPFPGMNPYLENPELWPEVHSRLIVAIADALGVFLRPKYRVAIEKRVYQINGEESLLVGIPDVLVARSSAVPLDASRVAVASPLVKPISVILPVPEEVKEGYLEVREVGTGKVVTVIEVLSPKNKRSGVGRNTYTAKCQEILSRSTHFVEIDLLRTGESMPILGKAIDYAYRILVSRSLSRPQADLYAFKLLEPIPAFPLPLLSGDLEPLVDIQDLLNNLYDRAGFDLAIDYTRDPIPPLSTDDTIWANDILHQQGLR